VTVDWGTFRRAAPELARAGERLLFHPGFGFGYLATIDRRGAPRIHPVMPILDGEHLVVFVVPSPKLQDLIRGRGYALHSSQTDQVDDEFLVVGTAEVVRSPSRRVSALEAARGTVGDDHVLVELHVERAMWAHYATPPTWPPTYERWIAADTTPADLERPVA
jgi:hypothetical protein